MGMYTILLLFVEIMILVTQHKAKTEFEVDSSLKICSLTSEKQASKEMAGRQSLLPYENWRRSAKVAIWI